MQINLLTTKATMLAEEALLEEEVLVVVMFELVWG
jgi:hypothetical protein